MNTQEQPRARGSENPRSALAVAADVFRSRQLRMRHDWYRFPWTQGPEIEPCLMGPEYLGNVVIGVTPEGMFTYEARPGVWQDVHPAHPEFLVDAVVEDRAGKPFPLPRRDRGNR